MPLYEFRCETCGHVFELLVREGTDIACPECGGEKAEKLLSTFSAHGAASAPACREGACPAAAKKSPCCGGGTCPFH